jgi:hypothetical protein
MKHWQVAEASQIKTHRTSDLDPIDTSFVRFATIPHSPFHIPQSTHQSPH